MEKFKKYLQKIVESLSRANKTLKTNKETKRKKASNRVRGSLASILMYLIFGGVLKDQLIVALNSTKPADGFFLIITCIPALILSIFSIFYTYKNIKDWSFYYLSVVLFMVHIVFAFGFLTMIVKGVIILNGTVI